MILLCCLLSADNYWNHHTALAEGLAKDLSTVTSPFIHRLVPWYVHAIAWVYLLIQPVYVFPRDSSS